MIMHCIISNKEFWCSESLKASQDKIVKLKSKNPKMQMKTFDIDSITVKHIFNNSIIEVKSYYKNKYKLKWGN